MFVKPNYLIKERVAFLKLTDRYDVFDPENGELVAYAKENIHGGIKFLRLLINKKLLPTTIEIRDANTEEVLFKMKRPASFFISKVNVIDKNDIQMGCFKSRFFSIGGRFDVFKDEKTKLAEVKGNWSGWDFTMTDTNGRQIGTVSKKWAGIGKEFFTSADNYMISIDDTLKGNTELMPLLVMAGIAIDVVYKEKQ